MGRRLLAVRAALGGYKQPQQLMALACFLSLGSTFDVVVNIDGFEGAEKQKRPRRLRVTLEELLPMVGDQGGDALVAGNWPADLPT